MENPIQNVKSMYLSTIPNQKKHFYRQKSNLDVSDIEGTRSRFLEKPKYQRESNNHLIYIQKSKPKQLIPQIVNKISYSLTVDDIEGTRTKINKFTTTRNTNPLVPEYQQPVVEFVPVAQPKFIRDNMVIDDIQGVRSRDTFAIKLEREGKVRDLKNQIIKDIKPTTKGFIRSNTNPNITLDVSDINKGDSYYQNLPKRTTNPLQPVYNAIGQKQYGYIQGSKHIVKNNGLPIRQNNSLITKDINGAQPRVNNYLNQPKQDIPGTKTSSLKRGVSSNRSINPLVPQYQYPGWSQNKTAQTWTRPKTAHQKFDAFIK